MGKNRKKKNFQDTSISNIIFKDIPACILGTAMIVSLVEAMTSYTGVRGIKLNTLFIFIGMIFFEIILIMVYKKLINTNQKSISTLIAVEYILLCIGLTVTGYFIQANYRWDLIHLHMSATNFADKGYWGYSGYFSIYPKQRNYTVFLGLLYKLEKLLGINDYRFGGTVAGIIMAFVTVYFSGKIVRMLLGKKAEALSLLVLILNPTFYLCVSYYYKHMSGVMCEILVLYFVLRGCKENGEKENNRKFTDRMFIIGGTIAGIGCFFLESVGIGLIAAVLYIVFSKESNKIRKLVMLGGFFVVVLFLLKCGINVLYDWDLDENKKFPLVHWFLLGLYGDGGNNSDIFSFTYSFATPEEKTKADLLKIIETVKNSGISGMLQLWINKQCKIFSQGLSNVTTYTTHVGDYNSLWRYCSGPKRLFMEYYAQIYISVILMNCLSAIIMFRKIKIDKVYMLFICVFGHVLFHSFSESNSIYLVTFLPMLIILSVIGFHDMAEKINIGSKDNIQMALDGITVKIKPRIVINLCVVLSLLSLLIYFASFKSLYRDVSDVTMMRAANQGYYMCTLTLSNDKVIGQTFRSRQCFNSMELYFDANGADESVMYQFELLDNSTKEVMVHSEFDCSQIDNNGYIQFDFKEIVPEGWGYYTACVSALNEGNSYISIYGSSMGGEDDFYNYGEAIGTDGYMNDLYFVVNEKYYNVPYYPMRVFVLFLYIILIVEATPIICLRKKYLPN